MAQSIAGVLDGLFSVLETVFASSMGTDNTPVLVCLGPAGQYQPSGIVGIGETRALVGRPTMGPNRSREMAAETDLTISVYTPGDQAAQKTSTDCAFGLLATLEQYLRTAPNETLGGADYDAWVSAVPKLEFLVAYDPKSNAAAGRVTDITTTVTTKIRY
jgi:hypothetical protein